MTFSFCFRWKLCHFVFPVKIGTRFQGNAVSCKNFQENQRIVNNFLYIDLQMRKISVIQSKNELLYYLESY
ncbi:hypothetical protein FHG68_07650 [Leptospira weilii]|nr:hypothetical protein FHG67_14610 [Leptospira weilii]QDK26550.1 hypothetical protein FHG68_07650 [Leptospira weilii]